MVAVLTVSVALAASALIVRGTGTPNSNIIAGLRQNARDYFLGSTPCDDAADFPDSNLTGINYSASFFPLAFFPLEFIPRWCVPDRCNKWDDSAGQGVDNLHAALTPLLDGNERHLQPISPISHTLCIFRSTHADFGRTIGISSGLVQCAA
jgi:hypothetical protein